MQRVATSGCRLSRRPVVVLDDADVAVGVGKEAFALSHVPELQLCQPSESERNGFMRLPSLPSLFLSFPSFISSPRRPGVGGEGTSSELQ